QLVPKTSDGKPAISKVDPSSGLPRGFGKLSSRHGTANRDRAATRAGGLTRTLWRAHLHVPLAVFVVGSECSVATSKTRQRALARAKAERQIARRAAAARRRRQWQAGIGGAVVLAL